MNYRVIFLLSLISFQGIAQVQLSTKSKKAVEFYTEADNFRVRGQFKEAIRLLEQALQKDNEFVEAYYRLGLVYLNMKQYDKAIKQFETGLDLTKEVRKQKVFWFDLGEAYLLSGQYEKAVKVLSSYLANETQNKQKLDRARVLSRSATFALNNKDNIANYHQQVLDETVNGFAMQYFPVLTADQQQLIFTRRAGVNADEDLLVSRKDVNGKWSKPVSISPNIISTSNEGTCTISADGRRLIFTTCVTTYESTALEFGNCDLYESVRVGEEWTKPKNLGPNVNSRYWDSQPSLSADGRTLYFISDRPSGLGRRDVWISNVDEFGKWTKAVNAGKPINSEFDELSPFIHVNNRMLFFASNGLPGFGGYDIFYVVKDSAGWTEPRNIGAPVNNNEDQSSLFITADGARGYYSQDEISPNGTPTTKIFEIVIPAENQLKYRSNYLKGIVRDKKTHQPLHARIELINIKKDQVESRVESDSLSGEYLMVLTQGADYALYVNKKQYLFKSLNFNYSEVTDFSPIVLDVDLEKAEAGSVVILNNIFFELDEFELKDSSIPELHKMLSFLHENPELKVELAGHTDNSGLPAYNRQLSLKRAQSVYNYLVSNGIEKTRLFPKGYGPDQPISPNDSEAERKLNRRIEFRLIR